ncbi:MAG: S8 family serine peptidase [Eubacterium sp.]
MKRLSSVIISIIILSLSISPCYTVFAEGVGKKNVLNVGSDIAKMCAEYDEEYEERFETDSTNEKTIDTRLIVNTDNRIDEYGAVDSVYGFGYAFLQYNDESSANKAYEKYESLGYTVSYDSYVTVQGVEDSSNAWGCLETDSNSVLDYYKNKVNSQLEIAVIDSGIYYDHEFFKNRVIRTYMNFSSGGNKNSELDGDGHGTAVAGVIAQSSPDNVKISAYKIMDDTGYGTSSMMLSALSYIAQLDNKPDIINISCSVATNENLENEITNLVNSGVTVVASAGNDHTSVVSAPAIYDNVITVAATNENGQPCSFSNYGGPVDIAAPGENIHTASILSQSSTTSQNGTSFSAPFVASAAAIVLMENKNFTPEQVKQKLISTAIPFRKGDCYKDYGVGIVNFSNIIDGTRCKDVTSNYESNSFYNDISVELSCDSYLVDVYYTTNGSLPSKQNGTLYNRPIDITESTRIIAAAFPRIGSTLHSKYVSLDYYILEENESEYMITPDGLILNYCGNETELVVPNEIDGVIPVTVNVKSFQYTNVKSVVFPDSVTKIERYAFYGTPLESITANGVQYLGDKCFSNSKLKKAYFPNAVSEYNSFDNTPIVCAYFPQLDIITGGFKNCVNLSSIYIPKLRYIDDKAFYGCESLTQDLILPELEEIRNRGFAGSYFNSIILPECISCEEEFAFDDCKAETIKLGKITTVLPHTFNNCKYLKKVYLPKATEINENAFLGCSNMELLFVPWLRSLTTDIPGSVTVYGNSRRLTSLTFSEDFFENKYTFVTGDDSPIIKQIDSSGYADSCNFVNSNAMINKKGASVRVTSPSLRFGFDWDELTELEEFADNIEYGFVYSYSDTDRLYVYTSSAKKIVAANIVENNSNSSFNLVFTNIPKSAYNEIVSARAYVCIDGMYFYSDIMKYSLNDVVSKVLADESISDDIKQSINDNYFSEV